MLPTAPQSANKASGVSLDVTGDPLVDQKLESCDKAWIHYLQHFHKPRTWEQYFAAQAKQKSQLRILDISTDASSNVRELDREDEILKALVTEIPGDIAIRIIEVDELQVKREDDTPSAPVLRLSSLVIKLLCTELNIDPLMLLWNEPQPPFLLNPVVGVQDSIGSSIRCETTVDGEISALLAQSIPQAALFESKYLFTLDDTFKPVLPENNLQFCVPYRLFFTTKGESAVVLVIPYKGSKQKPIDLARSPHFRWNEAIKDQRSNLSPSRKLLAYYLQMTLEDVTAGWSRSTSWFSKMIGNAILYSADYPDYTVDSLTKLSLEGFKCLDLIMSLKQWSQTVEEYSKDQNDKLFLKAGWRRLNRRFDLLIQKQELLEKQMANAHTMISARISLQDVKSMNRLAYLGAFFLPGAFMAAFFGMNFGATNDPSLPLWLFFATAIPATILTFAILGYGHTFMTQAGNLMEYLSLKFGNLDIKEIFRALVERRRGSMDSATKAA